MLISWKRGSVFCFVLLSCLIAGAVGSGHAQSPRSSSSVEKPAVFQQRPPVFRSVLDQKTHMVTIRLGPSFFVSYYTRTGRLYRVWSGGLKQEGPQYGGFTGHLKSQGPGFVEQSISNMPWRIRRSGKTTTPEHVQFRGYSFSRGRIHLSYELKTESGKVIRVSETPLFTKKSGRVGLTRRFETSNVPEGVRVLLKTQVGHVAERSDVQATGDLRLISEREEASTGERSHVGEQDRVLRGELSLIRNGISSLETVYRERNEQESVPSREERTKKPAGYRYMQNSDCFTCHAMEKKVTGPSFQAIAERYENTGSTKKKLMKSIREGGSGNWGEVAMIPHPDLSDKTLKKMVSYILSLDQSEQADDEQDEDDLFLGVPSDSLNFSESGTDQRDPDRDTYPGLVAKLYRYQISNPTVEKVNEKIRQVRRRKPIKKTIARRVHFTDRSYLGPYKMFFHIEFDGTLTVDQAGTYTFRTVSNDGTQLFVNGERIIDNDGFHPAVAKSASIHLEEGSHDLRLMYFQAGGTASVSLQWKKPDDEQFHVVPASAFSHREKDVPETLGMLPEKLRRQIPGDQRPVSGAHPSFHVEPARPDSFYPRVGGMDVLPDGRLVVSTWDSKGRVYLVRGHASDDRGSMTVKQIARGLQDPLGLTVVDGEIYVVQRSELTHLVDRNGDDVIDEYRTVADDWDLSTNFHEFAFGLVYQNGDFFVTLSQSIQVGGPSVEGQERDRGRVVRIDRETGKVTFPAHGLRVPNGVGQGMDRELFLSDNQGDWLPASKILHLRKGSFYGAHSVQPSATAGLEGTPPVVWLPHDQIGNSPSQPLRFEGKPFEEQMIHGDVHHGGIKRVFVEEVHGTYQGAVFRFTQGLEAGVNRLLWGPDGALYVGGIGGPGNWSQPGKKKYGLQRMTYNGSSTFEMKAVRVKANGMEIELTEPIDPYTRLQTDHFVVKRWYYEPTTDYHESEKGLTRLQIHQLHVSDNRKRILLETDGLKEGHVIYIRIKAPFFSEKSHQLWSTEAWYTLNEIPDEKGFQNPEDPVTPNSLTEAERKAGWKLLFNGSSLKGWRQYGGGPPGTAWKVSGNTLMLDHDEAGTKREGGDLVTKNTYENFELRFEWKVEKGGESGVLYRVAESGRFQNVRNTGPEMQLLDNMHNAEARKKHHQAGDLTGLKSCDFIAANPGGQWNTARIMVRDGHVEHWLNGYRVLSYDIGSSSWEQMLDGSRYSDLSSFGTVKSGHIAFEDAGHTVQFRNIRIREIQ